MIFRSRWRTKFRLFFRSVNILFHSRGHSNSLCLENFVNWSIITGRYFVLQVPKRVALELLYLGRWLAALVWQAVLHNISTGIPWPKRSNWEILSLVRGQTEVFERDSWHVELSSVLSIVHERPLQQRRRPRVLQDRLLGRFADLRCCRHRICRSKSFQPIQTNYNSLIGFPILLPVRIIQWITVRTNLPTTSSDDTGNFLRDVDIDSSSFTPKYYVIIIMRLTSWTT